ncbi:hypothetical protein NUSPORA_02896 [Nucleospora cyclopteri]
MLLYFNQPNMLINIILKLSRITAETIMKTFKNVTAVKEVGLVNISKTWAEFDFIEATADKIQVKISKTVKNEIYHIFTLLHKEIVEEQKRDIDWAYLIIENAIFKHDGSKKRSRKQGEECLQRLADKREPQGIFKYFKKVVDETGTINKKDVEIAREEYSKSKNFEISLMKCFNKICTEKFILYIEIHKNSKIYLSSLYKVNYNFGKECELYEIRKPTIKKPEKKTTNYSGLLAIIIGGGSAIIIICGLVYNFLL